VSKETVYAGPDGDVHLYKRFGHHLPKDGQLTLEIAGWAIIEESVDTGHPIYGVAGGGGPVGDRAIFIEEMQQLIDQLESAMEIIDSNGRPCDHDEPESKEEKDDA
jgi:hypothetical protein